MEDDLEIDFNKLEKEFRTAVEADAKYQRENAAKFRAVEQRVGSYEEFKDIVAASHLKPLEKNDRIAQEKIKQPWNALSSAKTSGEKPGTAPVEQKTVQSKLPKTQHEFNKAWTQQLKTSEQKYAFLCSIGGVSLGKIFKTEISMGLLGEFVMVLNESWDEKDTHDILSILKNLSLSNRFALSLEFLSTREKTSVTELFSKLKSALKDELGEQLVDLSKKYKVTLKE